MGYLIMHEVSETWLKRPTGPTGPAGILAECWEVVTKEPAYLEAAYLKTACFLISGSQSPSAYCLYCVVVEHGWTS